VGTSALRNKIKQMLQEPFILFHIGCIDVFRYVRRYTTL